MKHGFIDLHTHGIGRYDTRTSNPEDILKIAELHAKTGTSAILPTIYPGSINEMRKNIEAVRKAMRIQGSRVMGQGSWVQDQKIEGKKLETCNLSPRRLAGGEKLATILGVHLEGPFLNPLRCGALNKNSFIKPTLSSLKKLISDYKDIIKIITIAPEMPGALRVIEKCVELGIRVNMGHSDATYTQAVEGKKAGATGITHIFNAMRPFHHREPGLVGLGLIDENLYVEVIADGVHLHPKTLELIFNRKRLDRIILVSDSVKGAPSPIPLPRGEGTKGRVKGILAGSGITISDSMKVLKGIGIPDAEIMEAAVDNPQRYLIPIVVLHKYFPTDQQCS